MNQEKTKSSSSAVGDIFMQNLKKQIDIIESNSESVNNALPIMLGKIVEGKDKTEESLKGLSERVRQFDFKLGDMNASTTSLKERVVKGFNVINDVLMDFEKEYDMMRSSILWTNRKTTAMFIFMTSCTIMNAVVLIKLSAMM